MEAFQIVLLIETSRQLGRSILQGVIRWSQLYGPAALKVSAGHFHQELPKIDNNRKTGILARISDPGVLQLIREKNIPTVVLEPNTEKLTRLREELGLGVISINSTATGICGADYLYGQGFQKFAFCGFPNRIWSEHRERAFVQKIAEFGFSCSVYPAGKREMPIEKELPRLRKWINTLSRGTALMACDDDRARQILGICEQEQIRIPRDLAVLGAADDELLCELSAPPLSSIAFNLEEAGFEAMKMLFDLLKGNREKAGEIIVDPLWITTRLSTDCIAQNDRMITEALRFIRRNYLRPIGVLDVVRHVDVSRRTLENRFFAATGRTVMEDIVHQRIERAKQLLASTDESIARIGTLAGFFNYRSMLHAFNKYEKITPNEYRRRHELSCH